MTDILRHIAYIGYFQCCGNYAPLICSRSSEVYTKTACGTKEQLSPADFFMSGASTSARLDPLDRVLAPTAPQEL